MEVGIDIVQNRRVNLQPKFLGHVLSAEELKLFDQFTTKRRKREFVAGR
jgi:phosphopantetheinyl transferase (holo-ACP synthase)